MTGPFRNCLADALAQAADAGPDEQAALRQAAEDYDELYAAAAESLSPDEADRSAAAAVMTALEKRAIRAKQVRALSIRARRRVLEGVAGLKTARGYQDVQALGGKGGGPPKDGWVQGGTPPEGGAKAQAARALELLVENKPGLAGGPAASIAGRHLAIRGQFDAGMAAIVEAFESKTGFDSPGRALLDDLGREAFGEQTGDPAARALAQAWGETADRARLMFNAAGGDIGKREDWGLPTFHDPLRVRQVGREAWIEALLPHLNPARMTDRVTGAPFTEKRLRAVMSEIYDTISTGGLNKRPPGEHLGRGMLANQRGEERFFVFKDYDAWKAYQDQFGAGDVFGIMMGHLDEMARDIARMQILGPNPDHQWEWLKRFALREAALEEAAGVKGAAEKGRTYVRTADNMLAHFTGEANVPERAWLAEMGATTRSYLTGASLASAIISDVPSAPVFGAMARAFSGLSKTGDMARLGELIASPQARANARRSGFIIEQATDGLIRGAQDSLRLSTVGTQVDGRGLNAFARRLPAASFRVSGMTGWNAARKRSFRLEFMGALQDRRDMTLAAMAAGDDEDRAFAGLLAARGFSEADWAKIRAAEAWTPTPGASFLRPAEIVASAGEDLGFRVAEMIEMQTRQAVPETTLWTRAKLVGRDQPGTLWGEGRRSWAMFRSFTLTAQHLYAEDLVLRGVRAGQVAGYTVTAATGIFAALTLSGALSIQLRELAKGNDPRDMTKATFWFAAALQGGGLGILGDFFYASQSRAGKSSAMTAFGPAAAAASDLWDFTGGNVGEISAGLDDGETLDEAIAGAHIGRDATRLVGRYAPIASLWWARAAWDRAVIDNLQKLVDPEADEAFRARRRRLEREYGQTQWWPSGETAPARAPDLTTALPVD